MSTNILRITTIGALQIKAADALKLFAALGDDLPDDNFLTDFGLQRLANTSPEELLDVKLGWCGTFSGNSWTDVFVPQIVPRLVGTARLLVQWEGGDPPECYLVQDGAIGIDTTPATNHDARPVAMHPLNDAIHPTIEVHGTVTGTTRTTTLEQDFDTRLVNGRKLPPRDHAQAIVNEMVTAGFTSGAAELVVDELRNALGGSRMQLDSLLWSHESEEDKVAAYDALRFTVYRLVCLANAMARHAGEVPLPVTAPAKSLAAEIGWPGAK
jgi:hypothetical protein